MKKNYLHDCEWCTFLGEYQTDTGVMDLYYCSGATNSLGSLIARYSSEPGDYISCGFMTFIENEAGVSPELGEVFRRMFQLDLISEAAYAWRNKCLKERKRREKIFKEWEERTQK